MSTGAPISNANAASLSLTIITAGAPVSMIGLASVGAATDPVRKNRSVQWYGSACIFSKSHDILFLVVCLGVLPLGVSSPVTQNASCLALTI